MIHKNGALPNILAKIHKPFCCVFVALILCLPGKSQVEKRAVWDSLQRSIIYLHGADSVFTLPLNKTFYAQLNHEKKKKHKTVRYRLARYSNPTEVEAIPVVIHGNNTLLCLRGSLQGDTVAFFTLVLSLQDEVPVLEMSVPGISVNEFSCEIRYRQALPASPPRSLLANAPLVFQQKKKRLRLHVYGNVYRIAFTGL